MKEIGGYFELDNSNGNSEYYTNLIALNTARNALEYLLIARKIEKLYIPSFLCDTVSRVCLRAGYSYEEYKIDKSFLPIFNKQLAANEYIYIVNYYGLLNKDIILGLKAKYNRVILDNVQAFFSRPLSNIDTIYSCRKFFGVPDGAYLATDCEKIKNLKIDSSNGRLSHILGRSKDGASAHYQEYKDNDESFYDLPLMLMSELTHSLLADIDYSFVENRRKENFEVLSAYLSCYNQLTFTCPNGPYSYPLMVEDGEALRKYLQCNKIYVATLWPNLEGADKDLANNLLPIPCDQRYTVEDMIYIVKLIKNFYNEE